MAKIYGNTVTTPMPVADWNQTDENKADYIKNKPTILTEEDVVEIIVENGGISGGDGSTGVLVSVEEVYVGTEPPTNEDVKIWVNPDGESTGGTGFGSSGFSPIIDVSKEGDVTTLTITDAEGTKTATINDGEDGQNGTDGVGIASIAQTEVSTSDGGDNIVTITLTDGQTSTFTVKNGSKGSDGSAGQNGNDGFSPTITANKVGKETTIAITDKNGSNQVVIYDGADGVIGKDGEQGVGIQSITQTTTSTEDNGVNKFTVTLTDETSHTFEVRNGSKGSDGASGQDGKTPVKGTDYFTQTDINNMVDATYNKIAESNAGTIHTRFGNIPSYHYDEVGRVVKQILNLKAAHPNHIVFGAISDNHIDNTNPQSIASVRHAVFALENVGAFAGCDFITNLGDNIGGTRYDDNLPDAICMDNISGYTLTALNSYNLVGNHDKSNHTEMLFNFIGKYNSFDNNGQTKIRSYGYDDYEDKKVRVICLNTCDYWNIQGGNGMSYEQKDFLMRAIDLSSKADASDWLIVILSHIPLDFIGGDYNKGEDLRKILSAYQGVASEDSPFSVSIEVVNSYASQQNENPSNYPTYLNGFLKYDYAGKNYAKIVNIHGHIHNNRCEKLKFYNAKYAADGKTLVDLDLVEDLGLTLDIIRISTGSSSQAPEGSRRYIKYGDYGIDDVSGIKKNRDGMPQTDTSATFYFIDLDNNYVYSIGYGADADRTIYLGEFKQSHSVTYQLTNCVDDSNKKQVMDGASYIAKLKLPEDCVLSSLDITMGGITLTDEQYSISNDGETVIITINEVTGSIVITAVAEIDLPYNNLFDPSKDGFVDQTRFASDGSSPQGNGSGYVSNYIECVVDNTIYVRCPDGTYAEGIGLNNRCIAIYDSNKATLFVAYPSDMPEGAFDDDGKGFHYTVTQEGAAWFRVAGNLYGEYQNFVVTVNEPILVEEE